MPERASRFVKPLFKYVKKLVEICFFLPTWIQIWKKIWQCVGEKKKFRIVYLPNYFIFIVLQRIIQKTTGFYKSRPGCYNYANEITMFTILI